MVVRPFYKFTIMLFFLKKWIEKIVTKKRGKIVKHVRHIFYPLFLPIWENGLWCA